jgi:hypothetical protein
MGNARWLTRPIVTRTRNFTMKLIVRSQGAENRDVFLIENKKGGRLGHPFRTLNSGHHPDFSCLLLTSAYLTSKQERHCVSACAASGDALHAWVAPSARELGLASSSPWPVRAQRLGGTSDRNRLNTALWTAPYPKTLHCRIDDIALQQCMPCSAQLSLLFSN